MDMDGRSPKRQRRSKRENKSQGERASTLLDRSRFMPIALSSRPKSISQARPSQTASNQVRSPSPPSTTSEAPAKSINSRTLHNFFQTATEGQRWSLQKFQAKRPVTSDAEATLDADIIEDDYDSYDEIFSQYSVNSKSKPSAPSAHQLSDKVRPSMSANPASSRAKSHPTKRFLMPSESNGNVRRTNVAGLSTEVDSRPWAQRYAPSGLDELAVHKRKVSDVQKWLEDAFSGRSRERLLVLRGPAGSGKTTTISLLSKCLEYDVIEWRNPAVSELSAQGYMSVSAHFEEFLGRGDRFGGLDLDGDVESQGSNEIPPRNRRILLVEEFPTVLNRSSPSLAAFRASLQRYLAAATDHAQGGWMHPPVVVIVSETLLSSASSISESLTVHGLLGPMLYNHPSTTIIDFNAIAPTFMQKALRLILEKEARSSQRVRVPGPAVLEAIAEIGDIRSAVSSLEFLCLKGGQAAQWGGTVAKTKGKKARGESTMTQMEEDSLRMISKREASLGMFHAVGKIVYNKRLDASLLPADFPIPPSPPVSSPRHHQVKITQVAVDELMDETGTDTSTFICALHENYPPSCDGELFIDSLNGCIEALSDSDLLSVDRRPASGPRQGFGIGANLLTGGVDMLRQDEISFQVASRGLLFALPYPVKRRLSPWTGRGRPGDAHRMLYPASLRLWRRSEEIEGLADWWMKQILDHSRDSQLPRRGPTAPSESTGVASWKSLQVGHSACLKETQGNSSATSVTMLSREDALLYQLPYLAQIRRDDPVYNQLNYITSMRGIQLDDAEDDELAPLHPQQSNPRGVGLGPSMPAPPSLGANLMLSDDEIVDE